MADKVKRTPAKLSKLVEDFDMEIVCRGSDYDQRTVSISDMNRPALQLVGFYDYFEPKRLQVFGKSEMTFLKAMKLEERRRVFDNLLRCEIPALIIARNMEIFPELLEIARKHGRTLLRSELNTVELTSQIIDYLNRALAPQITRHGVLMNINGQGVLLLGESGIGKSETAIELLKRGHRLVADDAVEIRRVSDSLYGTAPELIRHYIEIRGIGVIDVRRLFGMSAVKDEAEIDMVMNYGAARGGAWDVVEKEIRAVVESAHKYGALVKVIFEISQLSLEQVAKATEVSIRAGADFVKTSTGFNGHGATPEAVQVMLDTAKGRCKVKPSGGIRDFATAKMYVEMGASRLGTGYTSCKPICDGEGQGEGAY